MKRKKQLKMRKQKGKKKSKRGNRNKNKGGQKNRKQQLLQLELKKKKRQHKRRQMMKLTRLKMKKQRKKKSGNFSKSRLRGWISSSKSQANREKLFKNRRLLQNNKTKNMLKSLKKTFLNSINRPLLKERRNKNQQMSSITSCLRGRQQNCSLITRAL